MLLTNTKKNIVATVLALAGLLILVSLFEPGNGSSETLAEQKITKDIIAVDVLLKLDRKKHFEVGRLLQEQAELEERQLKLEATLKERALSDAEAEEYHAIFLRQKDIADGKNECEKIIRAGRITIGEIVGDDDGTVFSDEALRIVRYLRMAQEAEKAKEEQARLGEEMEQVSPFMLPRIQAEEERPVPMLQEEENWEPVNPFQEQASPVQVQQSVK